MKAKDIIEEGILSDMAAKSEMDHEIQMARGQLYKCAKYSIELHNMLKGVSEEQGLEAWVQAKIDQQQAEQAAKKAEQQAKQEARKAEDERKRQERQAEQERRVSGSTRTVGAPVGESAIFRAIMRK